MNALIRMGPRARSKLRNPKNLNTEVTESGEGFLTIVDTGWAILDWGHLQRVCPHSDEM